jgi:hypothetical protein
MQIPVLSGISVNGDFRTEYPVNLIPVPKSTGISEGYLAPAYGCIAYGDGEDRGGIEWRGVLYRVLGEKLFSIQSNGALQPIGEIGGQGRVSMTYGFDYLAIASSNQLWLYDGSDLARVTDADLGAALDVEWIDGYFVTTDGEFLVVTELNNPFAVNPLKYGSSEADPDPVIAVLRLRSEIYAVNRYTVEVFSNVGGTGFPFQRITGAQIEKGAVGTHAVCEFGGGLGFIGSGRDEAPSVYVGGNGQAARVATREVDEYLAEYTPDELSGAVLEAITELAHQFLIVRLPRHTLVYDAQASQAMQVPVWFRMSSSLDGVGPWDAQNFVRCYGGWHCGRVTAPHIGKLSRDVSSHWGEVVGWKLTTPIVYGESRGAVFHELEAVALTGQAALGLNPQIGAQYSTDGLTWSQIRWIEAGNIGQRNKRLSWRGLGRMGSWRIQRIIGTSDAPLSVARLEARLEPLAY